jgi:hypothetical protein
VLLVSYKDTINIINRDSDHLFDDKAMIDKIRSSTRTGCPCGDDSFMSRREELLGRQLKALPRGRPFKK